MQLKHLALLLGISCAVLQADAQIGKRMLDRARQIGNAATGYKLDKAIGSAENKKLAKEYKALCEAADEAIANHDLRYFCAANRREELRSAAFKIEADNTEMDYKIQKFLSEETDLNNTDYIASAKNLLARSKAEEDIPTSNYLFKCCKIQYHTELEKQDPATLPALKELYNEMLAYENTFTNGRNKGEEIIDPEKIEEDLAERKRAEEARNYEKADMSQATVSTSSSSSSSSSASDKKMKGELPDFYNNDHEWKAPDGKVIIASVKRDGTVYRGSGWGGGTAICQIKKNGEIWVRDRQWGQVMKDGGKYVIYEFDRYRSGEPRERGTVSCYSDGTVRWDSQTLGYVESYHVKDRNNNKISDSNSGNTTVVHRAVGFFLYDKIKY